MTRLKAEREERWSEWLMLAEVQIWRRLVQRARERERERETDKRQTESQKERGGERVYVKEGDG